MKVSELIRELYALKERHGDIDVERHDGQPFSFIEVLGEHDQTLEIRELSKLDSRKSVAHAVR